MCVCVCVCVYLNQHARDLGRTLRHFYARFAGERTCLVTRNTLLSSVQISSHQSRRIDNLIAIFIKGSVTVRYISVYCRVMSLCAKNLLG